MYLTSAQCQCKTTPHGYVIVEGVEQYKDAQCRDKVVIRVDVFQGLTMFTKESLCKYRQVIYSLAAGMYRDKKQISQFLCELYRRDTTFQNWLGQVYYFTSELEDKSIWDYFVDEVRKEFNETLKALVTQCNAKHIYTSEGWAYLAVDDSGSVGAVKIPAGLAKEVYSRAKAWKCHFQEVEEKSVL